MVTCDALIVGGGPAGSTCAWQLRQAGLDVTVIDAATFPRDKVCAGWITPQVVTALRLDTQAYALRRTFQPITGFRVGVIGGSRETAASYAGPTVGAVEMVSTKMLTPAGMLLNTALRRVPQSAKPTAVAGAAPTPVALLMGSVRAGFTKPDSVL